MTVIPLALHILSYWCNNCERIMLDHNMHNMLQIVWRNKINRQGFLLYYLISQTLVVSMLCAQP